MIPVLFVLSINICDFNLIWGQKESNLTVIPISTSISINLVNVYVYDICTKSGIGK